MYSMGASFWEERKIFQNQRDFSLFYAAVKGIARFTNQQGYCPFFMGARHVLVIGSDFHYNPSMFEWRFRITPGIIPQPFLETAYFAGWGRIPRLTQTVVNESDLFVRSDSISSGTIHVPMIHPPLGVVMESTESLLSRQEPYFLVKELARGSLGRFYRRLLDWQMLGFLQPENMKERLSRLARRFANVIVENVFSREIEQEFVSLLDELTLLIIAESKEFTEQSLTWRTRNHTRLPLILGIGMNTKRFDSLHELGTCKKLLEDSFHVVLPLPTWRDLETQPDTFNWEKLEKQLVDPLRFGFQIVLGPLISFSLDTFPEWLLPRLSEEGYFESRATRFVNTMALRYGYLAHSWILANRFMDQSLKELPPERSLALIRMLAGQMRSRGIAAPIIVGIDQPWGEYALQRTPDWEQVQIAEALMGCQDIDTFLLEMNFGRGDHLTLPRDPMTIGNMVDQWSFLGKKVYVSFSVPSAGSLLGISQTHTPELQWSEELQKIWTEMMLLALLGKRTVRGIFWSCLQDPIAFPPSPTESHYGLLNAQQTWKSAFKHFATARKNLLR